MMIDLNPKERMDMAGYMMYRGDASLEKRIKRKIL